MANRFCGSLRWASWPVMFSKAVPPSELKVRLTTHWTPLCGIPAVAPVSLLPWIRVGPSRYFSVPSRLQENSGWSETSTWLPAWSQVKAAKSAVSASLGWQPIAWSGGVPWPSAVGRGVDGAGGAVGSPGSGRLSPLGLALGAGVLLGADDGAPADSPLPGSPLGAGVDGSSLGATGGVTCSAE